MGKNKLIQKTALKIANGTDSEDIFASYWQLKKILSGRFFERDIMTLLEVVNHCLTINGVMETRAYLLLDLIKEEANETSAGSIARLLMRPELYSTTERSGRCALLNLLGRIGNRQTVQQIKVAASYFKNVAYQDISSMNGDDGKPWKTPAEALRLADEHLIARAIKSIKTRHMGKH
jgi:hypothetical protein